MEPVKKLLGSTGTFLGLLFLVGGVALVPYAPPVFLALSLAYGWMLFAYLHYRWGRQEEFLQLLTAAVESGAPLAPAVAAYVHDRPRGPLREFWVALLLFFVVPGYYWVWHRQHSFDRKAAQLAEWLALGVPLHQALQLAPGVASSQTILAARVGEATGRLAFCLRAAPRSRLAAALLEALPRLFYPMLLLVFMSWILGFWMLFIFPKVQRIFVDFKATLPEATQLVVSFGRDAAAEVPLLLASVAAAAAAVALLAFSSTARWYFPGLGRVYRMDVQARVLKMLSVFLESGTPLPEALDLLDEPAAFPPVARRRLRVALEAVEQGAPLAAALRRGRLLPRAMVPLVEAAERARRLPWALAALADELSARTERLLKRFTQMVFPLGIGLAGVLAYFLARGMFLPLVDLIWRMLP
jgi:type II secretory pathway component PulF